MFKESVFLFLLFMIIIIILDLLLGPTKKGTPTLAFKVFRPRSRQNKLPKASENCPEGQYPTYFGISSSAKQI